jgi:TPR repeat protein
MNFRRQAIGLALGLCFSVLSGAAVAGYKEGATAYEKGDYAAALHEFRPLVEQGDAKAQNGLGVLYEYGRGVAQDYREAARWYRLAAAQGHAKAQSNLGGLYISGRGMAQDYREAAKWYRLAAAQGIADAQNNLGFMYRLGLGLPSSPVGAYALFSLSAANDPSTANRASANRTDLIKILSPQEIDAGRALTREMGKPGNFLAALDRYVETKGSGK